MSSGGKRGAILVLGALLLCFVAATGARPLNVPDEGRYAEIAREMLRSGDFLVPRLDGVPFLDKPPLFYWLEAGSFAAFGVHVWSARLVPALLGFLGCVLAFVAGARLYGRRAGLLAALVLAANPYYFVASEYVNHDLAVSAWITAALVLFLLAEREEGRARRLGLLAAYAAAGLAILTKGLIGIVLPAGIVGVWVAATWRWRELRRFSLLAGLAVTAAVAVPWHLLARREVPDLLHYLFVVQHFERYSAGGFNNENGPLFYPLLLAGGLLPWTPLLPGAALRAWRAFRADREGGRADLLLLAWPLVVVLFFSIPRSKIAGYALPALPPLAILLGRHLDALLAERARSRGLAVAAGLLALLGAALVVAPFAGPALVPKLRGLSVAASAGVLAAGVVALAAAAAGVAAWRRGRPGLAIAGQIAFVAAMLAASSPLVPHLTRDSTAPLAARLRPLLREGDVVASYRRYYYDLPLYLDRAEPIVVAEDWNDPEIPTRDNWQSELWLGRRWAPQSSAWLVHRDELGGRCAAARCFVLAPHYHVAAVRARLPVVPIAEANGNWLLGPADATGGPGLSAPRAEPERGAAEAAR